MKKTKNNLISVIVLSIIITSFLIGSIAVTSFKNVIDENNHEIMLHYCTEHSEAMNQRFSEIEDLVNTLADYYAGQLNSPDSLKNDIFLDIYTGETGKIAYSIIQNNDSIVSTYFRFNPEITNPTAGFFISRTARSSTPEFMRPTDLSKYDSSDVETVGWYHIPAEKRKAVWLDPYKNPNNGIYMISYVKPIYIDKTLVGVVGIDLDFDVISEEIDNISLYKNGYALLLDKSGAFLSSGNHSPVIPEDTLKQILGEKKSYIYSSYIERQQLYIITSHKLRNGDYLALIVPEMEVYATRNRMIFTIILIAIAVSTMVLLILTGMINHIINANRIDELTGARNRNDYLEKVATIENAISSKKHISFAVLVFDVNGLKAVNDATGHTEGDKLIINSYKAIKSKFPGVDVYRIGGDEFVVFVEKYTAAIAEKRVAEFRNSMNGKSFDCGKNPEDVIISCGYALYNPKLDASYEDTFNRADRDMYEDKEKFYKANPHLKRRRSDFS